MQTYQLDNKYDLSDVVLYQNTYIIGTLQNCFFVTDENFQITKKKFCKSSPLKIFTAQEKLFVFCYDGILRIYSLEDYKETCNLEFKAGYLKRRICTYRLD